MTTGRLSTTAAAALAAALAAACAGTPPDPPASLTEARQSLEAARQDPRVPRYAPQELNQAGRALEAAEQVWRAGAAPDVVAHRSYLARQEARIAAETAQARSARSEIEQADARRRGVVAEAQRRQAEVAQARSARELEKSESALQESARERDRAEAARQQALREREQAELARQKAESEIRTLQSELKELQARPTERGWVLTLGSDVLFDVGQATLKPGARRAVDNLARFLQRYPDRSAVVEGFTDSTGSDELNQQLSQRRAEAVRQALVNAGVEPARVEAQGRGPAYPVATNDTAAGRQLNRRVEIQISEAGGSAAGPSR